MLIVTPVSLSFTSGTGATQNLTFSSSDSNPVSLSSLVFPPGNTAQHPRDVELAGPFTVTSPLGDGVSFTSAEIIPGRTLVVPVTYSGTGTGTYTLQITYNGYGGVGSLSIPISAS